jgi:TerC family integral membrane protein
LDVATWIWIVFSAALLAVLLVDVLVFHRSAGEVGLREAGAWTAVWLALAVGFAGVVWAWQGGGRATEFLTGYVVERSLSIDNVFVLAVIFAYFGVPPAYRYRALLWGVLGALVLRVAFIAVGAVALERFAWTVYVLGAFLIATGVRLAVREVEAHPDRNVVLRLLRRVVPMTGRFHGQRLLARVHGRRLATPMLAVLVAVATTDAAFAADSVPAIFAVTDEPFLVFAANAFSVLGMLALYFLVAGLLGRFRFLRPALAAILVFVGVKLAATDLYHLPAGVSLAAIIAILGAAVAASLLDERRRGTRIPDFGPSTRQEVTSMHDRFDTILVGVDGSAVSLAALSQARRLLAPGGRLVALTVSEDRLAVHAGFAAPRVAAELEEAAAAARERAGWILHGVPDAEARVAHGRPAEVLLATADQLGADLVAVGSRGHRRGPALVVGTVVSEVLHRSRTSVLVARGQVDAELERLVVGVDGSPESLEALAVAGALAGTTGARVRVLTARGADVDADRLADAGDLDRSDANPVDALVAAAEDADLVLLGSHGKHGVATLRSVGERVAHRAACSVLVVRGTKESVPRTMFGQPRELAANT